jgi:hypothetical protein
LETMRTVEEINAEIEALRTRTVISIEQALDRAQATMAERTENGEPYEKWLAKQYHGHLQVIYRLSSLNPIPMDGTLMALEGNTCLAQIIRRLGWDNAECFQIVADDMLLHFTQVVKLKKELAELEQHAPETISEVATRMGMNGSSSIH